MRLLKSGPILLASLLVASTCTSVPAQTPGPGSTTAPAAVSPALASLRRSTENATDAKKVVDRYKQFIEMNKGTPAGDDAQGDLAIWEDRLARGLIKFGGPTGKWVDPAEADGLRAEATDQARLAVTALDQSRLADADAAIAAALAIDPANAAALYLRGVLTYRQDKLADARRAFDGANAANPGYGPTLSNLAATAFRLSQWNLAIQNYDQAMLVMPLEKGLLSNVAEAMEALPENQKNTTQFKKLKRRYDEQLVQLSLRLAQQGLYPWGATWVNQKQLSEIKAAEKAQKDELDKLAGQYDQLVATAKGLDDRINANISDMKRMEAETFHYDQNGNIIQTALPQIYYTVRNQTEQMKAQRVQIDSQQAALRAKAKEIQKSPAAGVPKFTGIQQLYAAAAAPNLNTARPASPPSTRP